MSASRCPMVKLMAEYVIVAYVVTVLALMAGALMILVLRLDTTKPRRSCTADGECDLCRYDGGCVDPHER